MKTLLLISVLALAPLGAQQPAPALDPNQEIQKLVTLKYVDPRAVQRLLLNFGVATQADPGLR